MVAWGWGRCGDLGVMTKRSRVSYGVNKSVLKWTVVMDAQLDGYTKSHWLLHLKKKTHGKQFKKFECELCVRHHWISSVNFVRGYNGNYVKKILIYLFLSNNIPK